MGTVTVKDLLGITGGNIRLRIMEDGEQVFIGWAWKLTDYEDRKLYEQIEGREIRRFKFHLDIRHKKWREKGLMQPLEPENAATYKYSDLQEELYYEIHITR